MLPQDSPPLFDVPPEPLPVLEQARRRWERAADALAKARALQDATKAPIPSAITREYQQAEHRLAQIEAQEARRS